MSFRELAQPLRGIIPPMVTPLAGHNQLDEAGLERLVEHMIAGGVHGLFILGSCGEGPSLSARLRRQLIDRTCQCVDSRMPVLVGVTDPCYDESLSLASYAADAGADAVVISAPYYFPINQSDLLAHFQRFAQESPLPVTLYNMPALTRMSFEPETVERLAEEESIVGIKDSSGDLDYFQRIERLRQRRPDWTFLIGQEHLLAPAIERGADGGVCGGANVWPQVFVQIYDAALASFDTTIAEERDVLPHLVDQADRLARIYQLGSQPITASSVIRGLKSALAALGICSDAVALPLQSLSATEFRQIAAVLRELGLPLTMA